MERLRNENAVFADQLSIKMDGAAAPVWALNVHEIPVHLGVVPVFSAFVALPRGEVEGAADFFVKQDIPHRFEDVRIEGDRKFPDITRPWIAIQDGVKFCGVVRGGVDDTASLEFKADIVEGGALVDGRGVVADVAFHAVFHGSREDLAVWNVVLAAARDRCDAFD